MYETIGNHDGRLFNICKEISRHLSPCKTVVITWVMGLAIAIPPLIGFGYYAPEPSGLR